MFFYYWVPSSSPVYFNNFKDSLKDNNKKNRVISDIKSDFSISLEIDSASFDISLNLLRDSTGLEAYTLKCVHYDESGLMIYEELQNIPEETKKILTIQAYHLFKDFFHIHEFHESNHDSILEAYVSEHPNKQELAFKHYCTLYIKKFTSYKKKLSLNSPNNIVNDFKNQRMIGKSSDSISAAKEQINRAYGEMIYAEFLINYLKDIYSNVYKTYSSQLKKSKCELDIEYRSYESAYEQIDMAYARALNSWQIGLGIGGFILGLIGIFK